MNEFSLTQEEVAKKIGKERSTIANFLRILKLPREVIQQIQRDELSFGHAKILVSLKDDEKVKRMAREAIDKKYSVRELEKAIKSKKSTTNFGANKFFDEQVDALKTKLESKTGYHFDLKTKINGSGIISIKYGNEAEFNDIYNYLTR
jgi:ParB family chromosome partitioning protein